MRKLPLLFVLLLFAVLATAIPAQAALPAVAELPAPLAGPADEEEEEAEEAEDEGVEVAEEEECIFEEDEWLFCEEEEPAAKQAKGKSSDKGADDECLLKNAKAAVTVNPGKRRLRLSVHYRTWKPATVTVEAVLHGVKGAVYLGTDHARFRRSGVYRDTYELAEKQMKKALAAREVEVELHVVNTPPSCAVELTGAPRRAKH